MGARTLGPVLLLCVVSSSAVWHQSEGGRERCGLGKYRLPSSDVCKRCPPGKFAGTLTRIMHAAKDDCMTCPAPRVTSVDRVHCSSSCARGSHPVKYILQARPGSRALAHVTACEQCPAGQHETPPWQVFGPGGVGKHPCTECAMGRFSPRAGAALCTACPAGRTAQRNGARHCDASRTLGGATAHGASTWLRAHGGAAAGFGAFFVAFVCAVSAAPRKSAGGRAAMVHHDTMTTAEETPMMAAPQPGGLLPASMSESGRSLATDAAI